jgi:hypothetical protein
VGHHAFVFRDNDRHRACDGQDPNQSGGLGTREQGHHDRRRDQQIAQPEVARHLQIDDGEHQDEYNRDHRQHTPWP